MTLLTLNFTMPAGEPPFVSFAVDFDEKGDDTYAVSAPELEQLLTTIHGAQLDVRLHYSGLYVISRGGVLSVDEPMEPDTGRLSEMRRHAEKVANLQG